MGSLYLALIASAFAFGLVIFIRWRRRHPLPPGPRPLPFVGNAFDMPKYRPWDTYSKWCAQYQSDLIYLRFPMRQAIVLGSIKVANALLDKRSHLYSERAESVVLEMLGVDDYFPLRRNDSIWRNQRKIIHHEFGPSSIPKFRAAEVRQARAFLSWVHQTPQDIRRHIRLMVTSMVVAATFGRTVSGSQDDYVILAEQIMHGVGRASVPGIYWVDHFPFLKHIPSWIPGTTARRLAEKYSPYVQSLRSRTFPDVKAAMDNGTAAPSVVGSLVENIRSTCKGADNQMEQERLGEAATSAAYLAAIDTTTSMAEFFLVAMALYPETQKRAQQEVDTVTGSSRLPEFDDIQHMPYVQAILLETMRWRPPAPFGLPHVVAADDIYEGYHIPKGTTCIPNIWGMMHNPSDFVDPEDFRPERFLNDNGTIDQSAYDQLMAVVFGFGRRMCPGRYFAQEALAIYVATVLQVFDISPGIDEFGNTKVLRTEVTGSLAAVPAEVPAGIKPRSPATERLILEVAMEFEKV